MNFPPKNILAPTDFSDGAEAALEYAFALAEKVSARVHLLHAYGIPMFPEDGGTMSQVVTEMKALGERSLHEIAERHQRTGATGRILIKMGDPRELIVASAVDVDADLIVMGTHGRRGLKRMFLGSVAEAVVRTAPCGVLVVPMLKNQP